MPGLNLQTFGGIKVGGQGNGFSPTVKPGSSAGQMAFGPGYTAPGTPSAKAAFWPNDPFGLAFWAGVLSLGILYFLVYRPLPE